MTKGGPGFASDVIASVIYKQYQAGFYGLSTAGNVILFLVVTVIVVPLTGVAQPGAETNPNERTPSWVWSSGMGRASIDDGDRDLHHARSSSSSSDRVQDKAARRPMLEFILADRIRACSKTSRRPCPAREYLMVHRLHQQRDPHRGQRRRPGDARARWWRTSWQRRRGRWNRVVNVLGAGRADRAAGHRADHLGAAEARAVQHACPA